LHRNLHLSILPGEFSEQYCQSFLLKVVYYFKLALRYAWTGFWKLSRVLGLNLANRKPYQALIEPQINSIVVQEPFIDSHKKGLELWRGGFFGKATLSRGEPTWSHRTRTGSKLGESLASRRKLQGMTPEELNDIIPRLRKIREEYQIMPEEAFFLSQAIGILDVHRSLDSVLFAFFETTG
jgi:hypothetical protein